MNLALSIFTIERISIFMAMRGSQSRANAEVHLAGAFANIGNEYRRRGVIQSFTFGPTEDHSFGSVFRFAVFDGGLDGEHFVDFTIAEYPADRRIEIRVIRLIPEIRIEPPEAQNRETFLSQLMPMSPWQRQALEAHLETSRRAPLVLDDSAGAVRRVATARAEATQTYTRARPLLNPLTILQMSLDDLVPLGRIGAIRIAEPFERSLWLRRLTTPNLYSRLSMAERMHRLTQALRGRRYTEIEARVIAYVMRFNGPEIEELRRCITANSREPEINLVRSWDAISASGIPAPGTENATIPRPTVERAQEAIRAASRRRDEEVRAVADQVRAGGITIDEASNAMLEFARAFPAAVRTAGNALQGIRQATQAQREIDAALRRALSDQNHANATIDHVTIATEGNAGDFGNLTRVRTFRDNRESMPASRIPTITVDSNFVDNCLDVSVVTAEGERLHGQISRELWQERRWYLEPTDALGMEQRASEIIEFLESIQEDDDDDDQETPTRTQAPISPGVSHVNYGALERRLMMDLPTANQPQPMTPQHAQIEGIIIDDWPFEMEAEYEIKAPQRRIMTTLPKEETAKKEAKKPGKKTKKKFEPDPIDPAIEDDTAEFDPFDFMGIQNED